LTIGDYFSTPFAGVIPPPKKNIDVILHDSSITEYNMGKRVMRNKKVFFIIAAFLFCTQTQTQTQSQAVAGGLTIKVDPNLVDEQTQQRLKRMDESDAWRDVREKQAAESAARAPQAPASAAAPAVRQSATKASVNTPSRAATGSPGRKS
jgi:hypothetical protein